MRRTSECSCGPARAWSAPGSKSGGVEVGASVFMPVCAVGCKGPRSRRTRWHTPAPCHFRQGGARHPLPIAHRRLADLLEHPRLLRLVHALNGIVRDCLLLAALVHGRVLAMAYLLVDVVIVHPECLPPLRCGGSLARPLLRPRTSARLWPHAAPHWAWAGVADADRVAEAGAGAGDGSLLACTGNGRRARGARLTIITGLTTTRQLPNWGPSLNVAPRPAIDLGRDLAVCCVSRGRCGAGVKGALAWSSCSTTTTSRLTSQGSLLHKPDATVQVAAGAAGRVSSPRHANEGHALRRRCAAVRAGVQRSPPGP